MATTVAEASKANPIVVETVMAMIVGIAVDLSRVLTLPLHPEKIALQRGLQEDTAVQILVDPAEMEIETTRDIARQMLCHRSFSFQEFSQRYADVSEFGEMFEYSEARMQDTKNRQNSIETEDPFIKEAWESYQKKVMRTSQEAYTWAINRGIAKEVARKVLPEGLTQSRMYMNGTLRSWIHFIEIRSGNGTQKEHMEVARECACAIAAIFPMVGEFVQE